MTRRLRVLEMIDRPTLGGGQIHLLTLARRLDKGLFDVAVAASGGGPLEAEARKAELPFVPLPIGKSLSRAEARTIAGVLRERGIDILHTHGGVAGLAGRRAAARAGTPVVVHTLHGIHYLHYRNPFLKYALVLAERRLARRTDAVIFVSRADYDRGARLRLAPKARMRLIRNGVEPLGDSGPDGARRLDALRASLKLDGPLVAAVSRLHRQKGVVHLLKAAPEILGRCPAAKIAVAGGGPLEAELRGLATRLGLDRRVMLLGEREDARDILALADVVVLPSLWEGLPLVLLEAAQLGKAVVATGIDGVREVLRDGETGLLVPPARPEALAEAVSRLLAEPGLAARLGEAARAEIPAAFPVDRMVAETSRLYLELASAKIPS